MLDRVTVPPWAEDAEMRRLGHPTKATKDADIARLWAFACLTANTGEIMNLRRRLQEIWDDLPDARYRECGNGQLLRQALDASANLDPPDWSGLLAQPLPMPRPS